MVLFPSYVSSYIKLSLAEYMKEECSINTLMTSNLDENKILPSYFNYIVLIGVGFALGQCLINVRFLFKV